MNVINDFPGNTRMADRWHSDYRWQLALREGQFRFSQRICGRERNDDDPDAFRIS